MNDTERRLLRHFLATLAYRTRKALKDAPADFASFNIQTGVRTPQQLLRHMNGVLNYALSHATDVDTPLQDLDTLAEEQARFHEVLEQLSHYLERGAFSGTSAEQLLQGPFADAMTHAGQLAMLRRLAGAPIPPENFHAAAISVSNTSADQPEAAEPDTQWFDAEGKLEKPSN